MKRQRILIDKLRELLDYNPDTGIFTSKIDSKNGRWKSGRIVGTLRPDGYVYISIDYKSYFAHQLAWFYVYEEWLPNKLDHENRIRNDNKISNLRKCDGSKNVGNTKLNSRNTSGYKGVVFIKQTGRWQAQIGNNGFNSYIGVFDSREDAAKAYDSAATSYFGKFATLNFPD